ncbi:hypothetical protein [Paenibacillus sp. IHBB 10380]|uniref:hypothetical protein n=1 Tax=Paenibacillus sp. IHBB 10380 TaxID=1566358 RepID=UPI0006960773|nr:hypothetical protein [Paenibacillus sp. IHBB 10380]
MFKNVFRRFMLVAIIFGLFMPGQIFASESESEAKTIPAPTDISLFTTFDPSFKYLSNGTSYITVSDGKISMRGETYAVEGVDKIGVQLTLQRWTGSTWIDVYTGASKEESKIDYVYQANINISAQSGYYYRIKGYYWIKKGTVQESGTRYSSSELVTQ